MRRAPGKVKRNLLTLVDGEVCYRRVTLTLQRYFSAQRQFVWPCNGSDPTLALPHPGDYRAIVKSHYKLHPHPNLSALAHYHAHDLWYVVPRGHAIDQYDRSSFGLEFRFKNQGVAAVSAADISN